MNKSTKIRINYIAGALISVVLIWSIGGQLYQQFKRNGLEALQQTGPAIYGVLCLLLLPLNIGLEALKWRLLVAHAQPLSFIRALKSVLCGIAFSLVTPNRIGEYPGRLLFLKQQNTPRLISVAVLGAFAQLIALFLFGLLGLVYYNIRFPGRLPALALGGTLLLILVLVFFYLKYEWWGLIIEKLRWLRKFKNYGSMLRSFTRKEQALVIFLSVTRFSIFTAQYLFLLLWLNVSLPFLDGYCLSALFFWAMAVIPTISLAEVGVRAKISLFLFASFSGNSIGILTATLGLWGINLVLPALAGSILWSRLKIIK